MSGGVFVGAERTQADAEIKRELIQLMSLMLFLPLSELVKSAGAWRRRARRTRLTRSDKERSPDKALLHPCVLPLALLPPVSPLCLTSVSLFFFSRSPSVCLYLSLPSLYLHTLPSLTPGPPSSPSTGSTPSSLLFTCPGV